MRKINVSLILILTILIMNVDVFAKEFVVKVVTPQDLVVELVNKVRLENGLEALTVNEKLGSLCDLKAKDMLENNYYSHDSKEYGSAFDMMKKEDIKYSLAAENLVYKVETAEKAMELWMKSDSHKANILNSKFTEVGVGYINKDGKTYWVQMFIGK